MNNTKFALQFSFKIIEVLFDQPKTCEWFPTKFVYVSTSG